MTQYLLSVWLVDGEPEPPADVIQQLYKDVDTLNEEIKAAGAWVFAGGLHPPATATVVRAQDGEVVTTDGPFAETKEQILGYYLLECADLDEALEMAARIPGAASGGIEVRPIWELPAEAAPAARGATAV